MMKLKVKATYFDKVEDRYIYLEKEPVIEREEARAKQLIDAGVAEELVPEPVAEDVTEAEPVAEEKPAGKKGKIKK